jgi:hypothetical protein
MSKPKPPLRKPAVDLNKLDQFASAVEVSEAEASPRATEARDIPRPSSPWEEVGVRADVVKGMGVPLSEPHLLKLRFIAEHTKWSQRKFCQVRLEEAIDNEVAAILKALNG